MRDKLAVILLIGLVTQCEMSLMKRCCVLVVSGGLSLAPGVCLAAPGVRTVASDRTYDRTLEDQLKVISALQVEKQIDGVKERKEKDKGSQNSDSVIATGIIALPPPSGKGIDVSQYPLGYSKANMLESAFESKDAALIISAVPREGPPFAAKIIRNLNKQDFPYPFSITTGDLIFPYTETAWKKSPMSKGSVSLTAVLDPDGLLTTPDNAHFGFATSPIDAFSQSSKGVTEASLDSGTGVGEGASFKRNEKNGGLVPEASKVHVAGNFASTSVRKVSGEDALLPRREARISVTMKADGNPYSASELELLGRIDAFLANR